MNRTIKVVEVTLVLMASVDDEWINANGTIKAPINKYIEKQMRLTLLKKYWETETEPILKNAKIKEIEI